MNVLTKSTFAVIAALSVALPALAEDNPAARDNRRAMLSDSRRDADQLVVDAGNAYRSLKRNSIPDSVLKNAKCAVVVPRVITAAAVVGGSHGDGIATCKLANGTWSDPAFVNLNAGSIGAQVGAKSSSVVLYFTNDSSVAALKRGKFEFGVDASVTAGTFDRSYDAGNAGVIAYEDSTGAYVGASLTGGNISADADQNRGYYGRSMEVASILSGSDASSAERRNGFVALMP